MAWARNGTPNTLSGTADDCDITDLTANKFNQMLFHAIASGQVNSTCTLNNDGTSVYAFRYSDDGGTDGTGTSQLGLDSDYSYNNTSSFKVGYLISISGEEKLYISFEINAATAGASNPPNRREWVSKYVPSPDADVTRIDWNNSGTGDYAVGTNLSAIGTD